MMPAGVGPAAVQLSTKSALMPSSIACPFGSTVHCGDGLVGSHPGAFGSVALGTY